MIPQNMPPSSFRDTMKRKAKVEISFVAYIMLYYVLGQLHLIVCSYPTGLFTILEPHYQIQERHLTDFDASKL